MEYEYDETEYCAADERRCIVLVIYDITDDKRRTKMVRCLERYGVRVQKSAFEAFLTERILTMYANPLRNYLQTKKTTRL